MRQSTMEDAKPRTDLFVSDVQTRLDSLLQRMQAPPGRRVAAVGPGEEGSPGRTS